MKAPGMQSYAGLWLPPALVTRIEAWRAQRRPVPDRGATLRRLLDAALRAWGKACKE